MTLAQINIAECTNIYNGGDSAEDLEDFAKANEAEIEQNWDAGETRIVFGDGSLIRIAGPCVDAA